MKKILVYFILILMLSCQGNPSLKKENSRIKIAVYDIEAIFPIDDSQFDYSVDSDGKLLFAINGNKLTRYNLETKELYEKEIGNKETFYYDLVSSASTGKFGVLFFDQHTQYNTEVHKEIFFYEYDTSLNVIDTSIFVIPKKTHLLVEDFGYTSYFKDTNQKIFYFNHQMSYLKKVKNYQWFSFESEDFCTIDPTTGMVYCWMDSLNGFAIRNVNDTILIDNKKSPHQLSVLDKKILFYQQNSLVLITNEGHLIRFKSNFNPNNRMSKGVFSIDKHKKQLNILSL